MLAKWITAVALGLVLSAASVLLSGCGGDGDVWSKSDIVGVDQPSGDSSGGGSGGGGGGTPSTPDTRFSGRWASSYGDDIVNISAATGKNQYVTRLTLTQSGTTISGSGRVVRIFSVGGTAYDTEPKTFTVTGTASGDDATLVFRSGLSGPFDFEPTWHLRRAGSQIVGMYAAVDAQGEIVRSGVARWYGIVNAALDDSWVAAFTDSIPGGPPNKKDRTAELALAVSGQSLNGTGNLLVVRENDVAQTQGFNITRSALSLPELGFSFGGGDLDATPMDWFAVFDGNRILSSYALFGGAQGASLVSAGTVTWHRASITGPSTITHAWTAAFEDTSVANPANQTRSAYLATMSLQAQSNGMVTGTAQILDESARQPVYRIYDVTNGSFVGSQARLDLRDRGNASHYEWNLEVTGSALLGTYQFFDVNGRYASRGVAQWTYESIPSQVGTWTAAYFDTVTASTPQADQFAQVTISRQSPDGTLTGVGAFLYAGERSRRLFTVTGQVTGNTITWTWRGSGIFGDTVWRLRQSSNILYGTYTNFTSANTLEALGYAVWSKTSTSNSFTQ